MQTVDIQEKAKFKWRHECILNEKQTNSKLKDVVQDEQLNGKEEEETHKK